MYCSSCGAELSSDARYCPKCGKPADGTRPGHGVVGSARPKMALWKKILIGLISVVIVVFSLALFLTSGLVDPVERQNAALQQGDLTRAYDETSQAFRQSTSPEQFAAFVRANPILTQISDESFSERRVENGIGYLEGKLVSASGGVQPVSYRLVKENGEWKILGIDLKPGE